MTETLCSDCVETAHGCEPDMGDGPFAPGVCTRCAAEQIVFQTSH